MDDEPTVWEFNPEPCGPLSEPGWHLLEIRFARPSFPGADDGYFRERWDHGPWIDVNPEEG